MFFFFFLNIEEMNVQEVFPKNSQIGVVGTCQGKKQKCVMTPLLSFIIVLLLIICLFYWQSLLILSFGQIKTIYTPSVP